MRDGNQQPLSLARLVVEIRARAMAQNMVPGTNAPAGLDGLVNVACAHPTNAEMEDLVSIQRALAKPQAAHRFDPGFLEVLSATTIRDLDHLITDMLEDREATRARGPRGSTSISSPVP